MDTLARIVEIQEAFGNPRGSKRMSQPELKKFMGRELKNITSEMVEIAKGIDEYSIDQVRDGLCDIIVYATGALHKIGAVPQDDVNEVTSSLTSRLIPNDTQLQHTIKFYNDQGIEVYTSGQFPTMCVKSASDQKLGDDELPKGKFLKNVYYQTPSLVPLPFDRVPATPAPALGEPTAGPVAPVQRNFLGMQAAPMDTVLEDTRATREAAMAAEAQWLTFITGQTKALIEKLQGCTDDQRDALLSGRYVVEHHVTHAKPPTI